VNNKEDHEVKQVKKPLKAGTDFYRNANMDIVKFTRNQVLTMIKRFKREKEARFTNGYKFKHLELIEKGDYFCYSLA